MKAIIQRAYGEPEDVLSLQDIDTPTINDEEILVRVRAASAHPTSGTWSRDARTSCA